MTGEEELRKYTDALAVLDTLLHKRLVLLHPKLWDDKNDSFYIEEYAKRTSNAVVLALCLTAHSETYHHWKIFADKGGACIVLRRQAFLDHVKKCGLTCRKVTYRTNEEMKALIAKDKVDRLPFFKRWAFRHELEFRVIYGGIFADQVSQDLPLPLDLIERIVLSPWTPQSLYLSFKQIVQSLPDCQDIKVTRSLLIDNETWKDAIFQRGNDLDR